MYSLKINNPKDLAIVVWQCGKFIFRFGIKCFLKRAFFSVNKATGNFHVLLKEINLKGFSILFISIHNRREEQIYFP